MQDPERPASERTRVLVVEDDAGIAMQLLHGLEREGYQVDCVQTGAAALECECPDLILLDLGLPDVDGFEVCRALRSRSDVPIVVTTARGHESDRVAALDAGADDYVVKPFGFRELTARIRAVLRRAMPEAQGVYRYGRLTVDESAGRASYDGAPLPLTQRELAILTVLIRESGAVVSRTQIFSEVWDEHWYGPTKVLDVHVAALRRKLGDPGVIETVYGRGFRLTRRP